MSQVTTSGPVKLTLNARQCREFCLLLDRVFQSDPRQLGVLLMNRLEIRIDAAFVDRKTLRKDIFQLISELHECGKLGAFLYALQDELPNHLPLLTFARGLRGASSLEGALPHAAEYADPRLLTWIQRWICLITVNGLHVGTGVLIGPDLVLTNYHVYKSLLQYGLHTSRCMFDFRELCQGVEEDPGRPVPLRMDWRVIYREYSLTDGTATPQRPSDFELDYAVLRLAEQVGEQALGDPAKAAADAEQRLWLSLLDMTTPDAGPTNQVGRPINIFQHPRQPDGKAATLRFASGVIQTCPWAHLRTRYAVQTDAGSSGSPCFDAAYRLIALHHAADGNASPAFNQGIPIWAILSDLRGRLTMFTDQGVIPPWEANRPELGTRLRNLLPSPAPPQLPPASSLAILPSDGSPWKRKLFFGEGDSRMVPFIDRKVLRDRLETVVLDNQYRIVSVMGRKGYGKTHCRLLIECAAQSEGIRLASLDISQSHTLADACVSITRRMGLDVRDMRQEVLVDSAADDRVGRKFADWLLSTAAGKMPTRWWLVIEGLEESDNPSPILKDSLVNSLIRTLSENADYRQVTVMLLGQQADYDALSAHRTLDVQLKEISRQDLRDYVREVLITTQGLEPSPEQVDRIFDKIVGAQAAGFFVGANLEQVSWNLSTFLRELIASQRGKTNHGHVRTIPRTLRQT